MVSSARTRSVRVAIVLMAVAMVPACGLRTHAGTQYVSSPVPRVTKLVPKAKPKVKAKIKQAVAPVAPTVVRTYVAPIAAPAPAVGGLPPATPATVAFPAVDPFRVYDSPSTSSHSETLSATSSYGSQRVMLVTQHHPGWTEVLLPSKPNGRRAWVQVGDVGEKVTTWRIDVFLNNPRLVLRHGSEIVVDAPVGVGKPSTPSPTGVFYITDVTAPRDTSGPYGPRAYGTSAFSDALSSFDGEAPQIAIHGTNQPWLIPGHVSNGCLRLNNSTVERMMPILELGTPVYIHSY